MAEITVGTVLGPYRVIEPIGSGGMARVYRAHHSSLERDVAVKVLPEVFASDPAFLERFQQEARTVARLRHANIVDVFDFGEYDGQPYIVMEFMVGGTLAPRLGQPIPLGEAIPVVSDVAAGLDYAHDHGVLHRDIKPGNVFFDDEGHAVLGDFGLAKIMEAAKSLTTAGTTLGTPEFMSPEQALGRTVDRRTDVYSLGAVVYMMLTGRVPYSGDTPLSTMFAHVQQPLPPPRGVNPSIPQPVEDVLVKSLAKEPNDRFATAGSLAQALKEAAGGLYTEPNSRLWQATVVGFPTPASGLPPISTPPGQPTAEEPENQEVPPVSTGPSWGRRKVPTWVMVATIVVLFVATAALIFMAGRIAQQPAGAPGAIEAPSENRSLPPPIGASPAEAATATPPLAAPTTEVVAAPLSTDSDDMVELVADAETLVEPPVQSSTAPVPQVPAPVPQPAAAPPRPTAAPPQPTTPPTAQPAAQPGILPMGSEGTPTGPRPAITRPTQGPQAIPAEPMGQPPGGTAPNEDTVRPASSSPAEPAPDRPSRPQVAPMGAPAPTPQQ